MKRTSPDPAVKTKKTTGATRGAPGAVEKRVRADIAVLMTAHPMGEALAEMCYALARSMDSGPQMMVAAVNRELRANLVELARLGVSDDDGLDDELSTPVRDESES